jgi:hypothetical protein
VSPQLSPDLTNLGIRGVLFGKHTRESLADYSKDVERSGIASVVKRGWKRWNTGVVHALQKRVHRSEQLEPGIGMASEALDNVIMSR